VLVTFSKHISIHALWELIWSFSETWLDEQMTNGLLDPKNRFHVYRCDRGDIHFGGGVCIFVEKKLKSSNIDIDFNVFKKFELVACSFKFGGQLLTIVCVYIAPNSLNEQFF